MLDLLKVHSHNIFIKGPNSTSLWWCFFLLHNVFHFMGDKNEVWIVFCNWFDEVTEKLCLFGTEEFSCIMLGLENKYAIIFCILALGLISQYTTPEIFLQLFFPGFIVASHKITWPLCLLWQHQNSLLHVKCFIESSLSWVLRQYVISGI